MAQQGKSLAELVALREQGVVTATDEEIAEKRAARAERKAEQASLNEIRQYFPSYEVHGRMYARNFENTKEYLRYLATEVRAFRKDAVEKGQTKIALIESLKKPYYLAFTRLAPTYKEYNEFRNELGDLLIEGLKIQDREVKVFSYHYVDKLMSDGFIDWGWIVRMLGKKYVSRYGWALLRKHQDKLDKLGGDILGKQLDEWAEDPKTISDWERLSSEDGKPADMREIFPRR
jgi:hypothetical protein